MFLFFLYLFLKYIERAKCFIFLFSLTNPSNGKRDRVNRTHFGSISRKLKVSSVRLTFALICRPVAHKTRQTSPLVELPVLVHHRAQTTTHILKAVWMMLVARGFKKMPMLRQCYANVTPMLRQCYANFQFSYQDFKNMCFDICFCFVVASLLEYSERI